VSVDEKLKKQVIVVNRRNSKKVNNLWIFEKILLIVVIMLSFIFPVYCRASGFLASTNIGTGNKSYSLVSMVDSIVACVGLTVILLIRVIRKRLESSLIGSRVDEKIEIVDNKLFYTFRVKYQTPENKRNLIIIDLCRLKNMDYNEDTKELTIKGLMTEKLIGTSDTEYMINDIEMIKSVVKIWDYFNLSLYATLKEISSGR
jgi:hypothetical protein